MDIMLLLLILLSSDIEVNPDLPRNLTSNVGHINVGSLNVEDKFDEITTVVLEQQLDIFAASETWLNPGLTTPFSIQNCHWSHRICEGSNQIYKMSGQIRKISSQNKITRNQIKFVRRQIKYV